MEMNFSRKSATYWRLENCEVTPSPLSIVSFLGSKIRLITLFSLEHCFIFLVNISGVGSTIIFRRER